MQQVGAIDIPSTPNLSWGTSVVETENFTYVYGFEQGAEPLDRWAHVARAPAGKLHEGKLEYWDGTDWNSNSDTSERIADGLANQFSVVPLPGGRWAMLSEELYLQPGLQARTAPTPHGPWSEWTKIDAGPSIGADHYAYNATAHTQFGRNGHVLVGTNVNVPYDGVTSKDDQDAYRARFRDVDLSVLDP
jgi:hypothetical protein